MVVVAYIAVSLGTLSYLVATRAITPGWTFAAAPVLVTGLVLLVHREASRDLKLLQRRLAELGPARRGEGFSVEGRIDGLDYRLRPTLRMQGVHPHTTSQPWLVCELDVGVEGIQLELVPQRGEAAEQVRTGARTDVTVGDARFDDAFVVEAAPASLAAPLLPPSLREGLLAHPSSEVSLDEGTLRIARRGKEEEGVDFVRFAIESGRAVLTAYEAWREQAPEARAGGTFRSTERALHPDQAEIDAVAALRAARRSAELEKAHSEVRTGGILFVSLLVALVAFVLYEALSGP